MVHRTLIVALLSTLLLAPSSALSMDMKKVYSKKAIEDKAINIFGFAVSLVSLGMARPAYRALGLPVALAYAALGASSALLFSEELTK